MHIGIRPVTDPSAGGSFQYGLTMMEALCDTQQASGKDRFTVFHQPGYRAPTLPDDCAEGWNVHALPSSRHIRVTDSIRRRLRMPEAGSGPDYRVRKRPYLGRSIRRSGVELMLYPSPLPESFESGVPFVIAIHDLQHRLQPEFPEVSAHGQLEIREYLFRNSARDATLMLADSEVGRDDILRFYEPHGATADRVKVLPFLPASYLSTEVPAAERKRVREHYRLPDRYLFYPANFWPHKNHVRIVQAIGTLKAEAGLEVHVAFTGTSGDELARATAADVSRSAQELGIGDAVHELGYVEDSDMSALYAEAEGLVMPTFFGPTNIPVLEAWAFGCPVLTSDIRGIREQVGDAGVLVRPDSVASIAEGIHRLWSDENLRRELAERGRMRLASYQPEDYRGRLEDIVDDARGRIGGAP